MQKDAKRCKKSGYIVVQRGPVEAPGEEVGVNEKLFSFCHILSQIIKFLNN